MAVAFWDICPAAWPAVAGTFVNSKGGTSAFPVMPRNRGCRRHIDYLYWSLRLKRLCWSWWMALYQLYQLYQWKPLSGSLWCVSGKPNPRRRTTTRIRSALLTGISDVHLSGRRLQAAVKNMDVLEASKVFAVHHLLSAV